MNRSLCVLAIAGWYLLYPPSTHKGNPESYTTLSQWNIDGPLWHACGLPRRSPQRLECTARIRAALPRFPANPSRSMYGNRRSPARKISIRGCN